MNTTLINALLIIVLVLWIGIRQLSWRPVEVARMWRLPLILAAVGVFMVVGELSKAGASALGPLDIGVFVFELALSLGVGAVMGRLAHFRPVSGPKNSDSTEALVESRTGWIGFALWVLFIGLRVVIDVWATGAGSQLASSTALILIFIGANRAARAGVFALRLSHLSSTTA